MHATCDAMQPCCSIVHAALFSATALTLSHARSCQHARAVPQNLMRCIPKRISCECTGTFHKQNYVPIQRRFSCYTIFAKAYISEILSNFHSNPPELFTTYQVTPQLVFIFCATSICRPLLLAGRKSLIRIHVRICCQLG